MRIEYFFYFNVIESRKNIIEKELNLMKYFFRYKSKNVFKMKILKI